LITKIIEEPQKKYKWFIRHVVTFGNRFKHCSNTHVNTEEESDIDSDYNMRKILFVEEKLQVTRIRRTTMMKIHVIRNIKSHVKHVVFDVFEYMSMVRTLAWPVLAKLCSTACSVESSICIPTPRFRAQKTNQGHRAVQQGSKTLLIEERKCSY